MYTDVTQSVDVLPYEDSAGLPIADIFAPLLMEEDLKAKERMLNPDNTDGKELKSLKDMFYIGNKPAKRIFMKGEAGCGKTLFCLKMLDAWCQVKQSGYNVATLTQEGCGRNLSCLKLFSTCFHRQETDSVTDNVLQQCLAVFDLVFYLPLRHFKGNLIAVKDMIGQTVSEQCLNVMFSGKVHCLVILDGLDESPSTFRELPRMQGIVSCVLFCTTRPWKLTQFQLKFTPNDKVVQLKGLLPGSIPKVIEYVLINFYKLQRKTSEFKRKFKRYLSFVESPSFASLVKIPMMLTACCCMWYEEDVYSKQSKNKRDQIALYPPTVHTSVTHTYLSLIDSMIRRADEKCDISSLLTQACRSPPSNIPKLATSFSYIVSFHENLLSLYRLAYTDLVSDDTKLVFQKDELEREIGHSLVEIALKVGLISQTRAPGRFHQQNVSVNFYHKSVQEFLAAVHLTCTDTDDIRSYCTSLDKVMDVANIIKFGVALDPSFCRNVLKHVMDIVNADTDIQQYRQTFDNEIGYRVLQLYRTQCDWYRELTHSRTVTGDTSPPPSLHVTDIYLWRSDGDTVRLTGELMYSNCETIVSVSLWGVDRPLHGVAQYLPQCPQLSALCICIMSNKENRDLLVSVIPRLTQLITVWYTGCGGVLSDDADRAAVAAVMSLTQLESIRLEDVKLGNVGLEGTDAMTRLRTVVLVFVYMTAAAWDRFVTSLLTLPQSVFVRLDVTYIDEGTVERIQTSPRLTVTRDEGKSNNYGNYVRLEFTTSPSPT